MADEERSVAGSIARYKGEDTMAIVTAASQAQAAKVGLILERLELIRQMDVNQVKNVADLLRASVSDGGCGIGCW